MQNLGYAEKMSIFAHKTRKMQYKSDQMMEVGLNDLRPYANSLSRDNKDFLVIDNLKASDIEHRALHTSFFTIAYCIKGHASFYLNGQKVEMNPGDLFVAFGFQIIDRLSSSEDFQLIALVQSRQFVQDTLMSMLHLWPYLLYLIENPILSLNQRERRWIRLNYLEFLQRMREAERHAFYTEVIQSLLQTLYLDICNFLELRSPRASRNNSRIYNVFYQFMKVLSKNYTREREVAWYAEQLELTPKYLSEVVKQVSGRPVSQWISTLVVMEIKSLLRSTNLNIKDIAERLNFPNQSFMGKYFKNIVGCSPLDFRKEL